MPSAKTAGAVPLPPARLPNDQDNAVLVELQSAPLGTLEVDRFADVLNLKGQSGEAAIIELRATVAYVYVHTALGRTKRKASHAALESTETALGLLWKAVAHLDSAIPKHARGLKGAFAIPADDPKGVDEVTGFSSLCASIKSEIAAVALRLDAALRAESTKPIQRGKPKERLRILIEGLAELWLSATDKTISPSVKSKPRDLAPSVVISRSGLFLEFAKSILFELDSFNPTEVESAVTNVAKRQGRYPAR